MKARPEWLPLALLLVVLAGGAYVRLAGLGRSDFYNDELYMVYAAQGLERGDGPVLPSGATYDRGLDITRMVGLSMRLLDHPETAARLPSALFGVLGLVFFALIVWAMAGPWPAVWGALLLAIYPEAISLSRITRFYTYQLAFGLAAFYAGWRAVRTAGLPTPADPRRARRALLAGWGWILLALLTFTLAARVQQTTFSVLVAWGLCLAGAAGADLASRGQRAWRDSPRVQAVALGLGIVALTVAARPALLAHLLDLSQAVPEWAGGGPGNPRAYYWAIAGDYPVIIALLPACILVTAFRNVRLAVFLALWFLVPFALHSLVLPWKAERYLLLAMPAFFMLAAVPAAAGSRVLFQRARRAIEGAGGRIDTARAGAAALVGVVVCAAVIATPAFNTARKIPPFVVDIQWRTALSLIEDLPESGSSLVLGSSYPISSLYYWDRADFGVSTASLDRAPLPGDTDPVSRPWVQYGDGVPDYYTAVPVITRARAIRERFPDADAALIAIDRAHVEFGHVDASLADALSREAVELCQDTCGRLLLFYWRWDAAAPAPHLPATARPPGASPPLDVPRAGGYPHGGGLDGSPAG